MALIQSRGVSIVDIGMHFSNQQVSNLPNNNNNNNNNNNQILHWLFQIEQPSVLSFRKGDSKFSHFILILPSTFRRILKFDPIE